MSIYKPNVQKHKTDTWVCRIVKKNARMYTNIFGVPFPEVLDPENLVLLVSDCYKMVNHRSCPHGNLANDSGLLLTNNELDLKKGWPLIDSFSWKPKHAINCYAFKSIIESSHNDPTLISPIGELSKCSYKDGNCTLSDNSVLIWNPDAETQCEYTLLDTWQGEILDNAWMANNHEIACTLLSDDDRIFDCNKSLHKTL